MRPSRRCCAILAALLLVAAEASAQVRGRLQVAPNRRYLQYDDGRPFFYMADTAWQLFHRLDREEAVRYLEDRARKSFSVIQAVALAELDGLTTPNPHGALPLVDRDPARPNPDYFAHVDFIVERAESLGLFVGFQPGRTPVLFANVPWQEALDQAAAERPRLAVLTDIGGDPDDQQSLIRLMVYANEFEIELLIASAAGIPGELKGPVTRPDLIHRIIDAYGVALPNLRRHANGWPDAESLRKRALSGNPLRGRAHIGEGHDTAASRALIERIDAGTPDRPLNVAIWGGQTDFAQALWRVKQDRGSAGMAAFVSRFRVYDIADQDGLADWMREEFPGMHYILSKPPPGRDRREAVYRGMYLTGDESLTSRAWVDEHVRSRCALGALYPTKTWTAPNPHGVMKEGDTPAWFFFLPLGGNDPADPTKPGWGGRFVRGEDGWFRDPPADGGDDPRELVSRWRPDFQRDFAKRMAWCGPD